MEPTSRAECTTSCCRWRCQNSVRCTHRRCLCEDSLPGAAGPNGPTPQLWLVLHARWASPGLSGSRAAKPVARGKGPECWGRHTGSQHSGQTLHMPTASSCLTATPSTRVGRPWVSVSNTGHSHHTKHTSAVAVQKAARLTQHGPKRRTRIIR